MVTSREINVHHTPGVIFLLPKALLDSAFDGLKSPLCIHARSHTFLVPLSQVPTENQEKNHMIHSTTRWTHCLVGHRTHFLY